MAPLATLAMHLILKPMIRSWFMAEANMVQLYRFPRALSHGRNWRPVLRPGEILEFVPGMVVTQHSGSGKANQYFLRGFNLDHGTDFRTTIDGMPVNMRTHGHGQGYTDLSFIVPEFIQRIDYQKGPYHAENGDFSTAGSATFVVADAFDRSMVQLEAGADGYLRTVAAHSVEIDKSRNLLLGLDGLDGPWTDIDEDIDKSNLLLPYSAATITDPSHDLYELWQQWNAADQTRPCRSKGLLTV